MRKRAITEFAREYLKNKLARLGKNGTATNASASKEDTGAESRKNAYQTGTAVSTLNATDLNAA